MAGPQHSYTSGFPLPQQSTMRSQFISGPQTGLIHSPQQTGLINNQTLYSVALQQGSQSSLILAQQSAQLQIQQQLQQQEMQQQASQNCIQPQVNQQQQQQLLTQYKEQNTANLCKLGQEIVQEIVVKTSDLFNILKSTYIPNGTVASVKASSTSKTRAHEHIHMIRAYFRRLRLIYEKCNENCQGMEYTHIESLIPLKEEWDMKLDEKKTSELYRAACEENREVMEQVILKNRHLKEIIDHLRRIIWEINTMLTMRKS